MRTRRSFGTIFRSTTGVSDSRPSAGFFIAIIYLFLLRRPAGGIRIPLELGVIDRSRSETFIVIIQPFSDVEGLVVEYLESRVPDFPTEWRSTVVRAESFTERASGDDPRLSVRCEEVTGNYPITQNAVVRVTSWTDGRDGAKTLAHLAHAAVMEHAGDRDVVAVQQVDGVVAGFDPDVPEPFASFTVLVTQRPS